MNEQLSISATSISSKRSTDAQEKTDELNRQSFELRHLDQIKAMDLAKQALELAEKNNYETGIANALLNLGFQELSRSDYKTAFLSFNKALTVFTRLNDQKGIAHANYNLGLVYLRIGDFEAAMEEQQKSIRIRTEINDEEGYASCKSQIAYLNGQFGLDEAALQGYEECLSIWRKRNNEAGIGNIQMALGMLMMKLGRLQEAELHLTESLQIRKKINEVNGIHGSVNYLSAVYVKQNRLDDAYNILENALSDALSQKQPYTIGICRLRLSLAKVLLSMNQSERAIEQLHISLTSALESGQQYQLHDIYSELATAYKSSGQYEKALEYYEKFHSTKEAIINLNATTRLKNLEMISKVESREKEIEIHRLKYVELRDRNRIIREERKKSDNLLLNILPSQTARELKKNGFTRPRKYELVTVLFCDFVSFTHTSEKLSPTELVRKLDIYFRAFDEITLRYGVEKIKTIGDAYMAAGGLPVADRENPRNTVCAGLGILKFVQQENDPLFNIRMGIHSGPVVAGIVGIRKFAYDIWGDTVNIAARMESSGEPGRLNISETTYEFVKDDFHCEYRGKISAKKKGMMDMYFVNGLK